MTRSDLFGCTAALAALLLGAPALGQTPSAPPAEASAPAVDAPPAASPAAPAPPPIAAAVLQAPDLFSAAAGNTGLPASLWKASSADMARQVLPLMAQRPLSPATAAFARRLLSTGARAPDGAGDDADLAAARINAVLSLGDAAGAHAMLERTAGVNASPALSQVAAEADLVLGLEDQACKVGDGLTHGKDGAYWKRLRAYCLLRAGDKDGAQLAYDLADSQAKDLVYKRLMSAALANTAPGEAALRNGMDLALSQRLKLDLAPAVDKAWTPIAMVLAGSTAAPDAIRTAAVARLALPAHGSPPAVIAPAVAALQAGDIKAALAARALIVRDDASGATVLELALLDAALTAAQGKAEGAVMDQLVERGTAGEPKDRAKAQAAAALYAALGAPMSSQARAEFAGFDIGRAASQARVLELELASTTGAVGDVALLSLWIAADAGPAGPPAADRAAIVRPLNRVGFVQDARALAVEGLLPLLAASPEPAAKKPVVHKRRAAE